MIQAGAVVNYVNEPATIVVATTVTDEDEIHVFYPGSDREITPDSVTIAGGNVTIAIPRCRLVDPSEFSNPTLDYNDVTIYTPTVDVVRVYNDESIQAGLIYPHRDTGGVCSCDCAGCCATCGEYAENACEYIRNAEIGTIDVLPATFASYWTAACPTCYCTEPEYIRLNYKAGLETMTPQVEDAIIRLAHSKMPSSPCGCNCVQEVWTRDRHVPDVLTSERLNCLFGLSDGAWFAWRQAIAIRLQRGMVLG